MGENTQGNPSTKHNSCPWGPQSPIAHLQSAIPIPIHVAGSHVAAARQQRWLCINKCTIFRRKDRAYKRTGLAGSSAIKSRNVVKITFSGPGAWQCVSLSHSLQNPKAQVPSPKPPAQNRTLSGAFQESSGFPDDSVWTPSSAEWMSFSSTVGLLLSPHISLFQIFSFSCVLVFFSSCFVFVFVFVMTEKHT